VFRRDLYHRVYVFPIVLPPLRERREDIPLLVEHFARQICAQNGWKALPFCPETIRALAQYAWPGNIRELRNVIERLLLLADTEVDRSTLELAFPSTKRMADNGLSKPLHGPLSERVAAFEREMILAELERNHGHITNTAKALSLERSHLYKKCQQLGIQLRPGEKER
jgi:two-component system nitrogen regulation response regulator NtrX